jgi:hypothetical protein
MDLGWPLSPASDVLEGGLFLFCAMQDIGDGWRWTCIVFSAVFLAVAWFRLA